MSTSTSLRSNAACTSPSRPCSGSQTDTSSPSGDFAARWTCSRPARATARARQRRGPVRLLLARGRARAKRDDADHSAPLAGDRRGADGPGRTLARHNLVQARGASPAQSTRHLGWGSWPRRRRRRLLRRRALPATAGAGCCSSTSPSCALILLGAFLLLSGECPTGPRRSFNLFGAACYGACPCSSTYSPPRAPEHWPDNGAHDR